MPSPQKKYTTLVSNTLLFAISNFSSKLLSFFIRPYLSYALDSPDVMGVSSLLQQATNLLIPVVSLGVAYAIIRFGLDKENDKASVFVNGAATIGLGFLVLLLLGGEKAYSDGFKQILLGGFYMMPSGIGPSSTFACWQAACARSVPSSSAPVC